MTAKTCVGCRGSTALDSVFCEVCGEPQPAYVPVEGSPLWYYTKDKSQHGPVLASALLEMVQRGDIGEDAFVWTKGLDDWVRLAQSPLRPGGAPVALEAGRRPCAGSGAVVVLGPGRAIEKAWSLVGGDLSPLSGFPPGRAVVPVTAAPEAARLLCQDRRVLKPELCLVALDTERRRLHWVDAAEYDHVTEVALHEESKGKLLALHVPRSNWKGEEARAVREGELPLLGLLATERGGEVSFERLFLLGGSSPGLVAARDLDSDRWKVRLAGWDLGAEPVTFTLDGAVQASVQRPSSRKVDLGPAGFALLCHDWDPFGDTIESAGQVGLAVVSRDPPRKCFHPDELAEDPAAEVSFSVRLTERDGGPELLHFVWVRTQRQGRVYSYCPRRNRLKPLYSNETTAGAGSLHDLVCSGHYFQDVEQGCRLWELGEEGYTAVDGSWPVPDRVRPGDSSGTWCLFHTEEDGWYVWSLESSTVRAPVGKDLSDVVALPGPTLVCMCERR